MRALRLLLAGIIAATALLAGFFTAAAILIAGAIAYLIQLFLKRHQPVRSGSPRGTNRPASMRTDDVIDVVATKVAADPIQH